MPMEQHRLRCADSGIERFNSAVPVGASRLGYFGASDSACQAAQSVVARKKGWRGAEPCAGLERLQKMEVKKK